MAANPAVEDPEGKVQAAISLDQATPRVETIYIEGSNEYTPTPVTARVALTVVVCGQE
jgi:hypothetical protein